MASTTSAMAKHYIFTCVTSSARLVMPAHLSPCIAQPDETEREDPARGSAVKGLLLILACAVNAIRSVAEAQPSFALGCAVTRFDLSPPVSV